MALLGHCSTLSHLPMYSSIQPGCMTADWLCNCTQITSEPAILICVELQPGYITVHRCMTGQSKQINDIYLVTVWVYIQCYSSILYLVYTEDIATSSPPQCHTFIQMYNILVESMWFHGTTHYVCAHPQCLSVFCSAQHPAAVMTDI